MTRNNGYAGALIYARMSAADIARARRLARGDVAKLDELIHEKITVHLGECREYAEAEGWPVLGEYWDNMVSGNSRHRSKNQALVQRDAMMKDLRERAGQRVIVLSTEVERLYRDMDESRELVKLARLTPITVMGTDGEEYDLTTANGESRFEGAVSKAQRESGKVSERRRRRERIRAESGGYWGNEPFGYHKVYETGADGQRSYTGRLEPCTGTSANHGNGCWLDPSRPLALKPAFLAELAAGDDESGGSVPGASGPMGEADLIRAMAAEPLTRGASLGSIVRQWDAMGVTTRNGERWTQMMLRNLLLNKRLNGIRVHRAGDKWGRADRKADGTETRGQWPAVLDDELFATVRGILTSPERYKHVPEFSGGRGAKTHLLAGLAICGNIWGPDGGVREGTVCGMKMSGHPGPRPAGDGTRPRQYQCPKVHGGCGHCRRAAETADDWVIAHVLAWTAPGGPYEEYAAAEHARHAAGRLAVAAELARIDAEQEESRSKLAAITAEIASGEIAPGTELWRVMKAAVRTIEDEQSGRAARAAKLLSAAPVPSPAEQRADLALLTDPAVPVAVRADLVRRFVSKVIIRPPGQGTRRVFDPATIEVIPGAWADGLDRESLAVAPPAGKHTRHAREIVLEYVTAHPGSTAHEVAKAAGLSHSFACTVLAALRKSGAVTGDRERGTGRAPVRFEAAA